MKCLCCGWQGEIAQTCPKCGEASWAPAAVIETPKVEAPKKMKRKFEESK